MCDVSPSSPLGSEVSEVENKRTCDSYDHIGLIPRIQGRVNIRKPINVIHDIGKSKKKNHVYNKMPEKYLIKFSNHFLKILINGSHYGKQYGGSLKKLKIQLPHDPATPLLGTYPEKTEILIQKDTCTPMFIAALYTIVKPGKQPV